MVALQSALLGLFCFPFSSCFTAGTHFQNRTIEDLDQRRRPFTLDVLNTSMETGLYRSFMLNPGAALDQNPWNVILGLLSFAQE
jgi:hypothetical protein